jgi:hypothetical protein
MYLDRIDGIDEPLIFNHDAGNGVKPGDGQGFLTGQQLGDFLGIHAASVPDIFTEGRLKELLQFYFFKAFQTCTVCGFT